MVGAIVATSVALVAWFVGGGPVLRDATVTKAVVQVTSDAGSGTGFLVKGPDDWAYVVTAFHVINSGSPITVARAIEIAQDKYYIEAYPEAEIAGYDADTDLAVIRLRNVKASAFGVLNLAPRPLKGGHIKSYGFPGRTVMRRQGLLAQPGDVLSLGKFPVLDDSTGSVIRDNGVDGILISSSLEPGYSGGPTCDQHGDVVGVNAIRDRTKTQHNGAISVDALRRLLERIKSLEKRATPTNTEVKTLLDGVVNQYLRLLPQDRLTRREHEFIAVTDLPALRRFTSDVRRAERVEMLLKGNMNLSGSASLGLQLIADTGSTFSTYRHEAVQQLLTTCEKSMRNLTTLVDQLAGGTKASEKERAMRQAIDECDPLAVRPLAWDLTAMTLQWDPSDRVEHVLNVTKVEPVDDDEPEYRASVALKEVQTTFDVWVRWEGADLKLKLFDKDSAAYGLRTTRQISVESLNGKWSRNRARSLYATDPSTSLQLDETLEIASGAKETVTVRHVVTAQVFAASGAVARGCERVEGTVEQSFAGELKTGGAFVRMSAEPKRSVTGFESCGLNFNTYSAPIAAIALKSRGDRLIVYRTSGSAFPDEVEFTRR